MVSDAIRKHLGKIRSAQIQFSIDSFSPFDSIAKISLPCINAELFLMFWSTISFQIKPKATLINV